MTAPGSADNFMHFFESHQRNPVDYLQNTPRQYGDIRERVRRETVRGRYMFFHENIENYLNRQWRAYTVPRAFVFFSGSYLYFAQSLILFAKTFNNFEAYPRL